MRSNGRTDAPGSNGRTDVPGSNGRTDVPGSNGRTDAPGTIVIYNYYMVLIAFFLSI